MNILPEIVKIKKLYDTTENGNHPDNFHTNCNKINGTLLIAKSNDEKIAGSHTEHDWSKDGFHSNHNKFLFSVNNKKVYQIMLQDHAIYCSQYNHPSLGCFFNSWFFNQ